MKNKKTITSLIMLALGIWFFQYFLAYIPGAYAIVLLVGLGVWLALLAIAIFQLFKLLFEQPKHYQRLFYVAGTVIFSFLVVSKPTGIIDWKSYENEDLLVGEREGTANCRTIIRLKDKGRFKYESYCFGVEFYFGSYKMSNDTVYFKSDINLGYMDKVSYGLLLKSPKDTTRYSELIVYKNMDDKRNLDFFITKVNVDRLLQQK